MTVNRVGIEILPCLDSEEMAACRRQELVLPHDKAAALGRSALEAARAGYYVNRRGEQVDWSDHIRTARSAKQSLPSAARLPVPQQPLHGTTRIQVVNQTTLQAAHGFTERGIKPLALNFANGINPGGGFLFGALAQEVVLCRASALYSTLEDDPMYAHHRERPRPDSTDWAIYSPNVPVFRADDGTELDRPWLLSFLTCAAPYAPDIGQPEAGDLLQHRIHRVLAIARAYGYPALVLGAWGCGAFANDPRRTATDFRQAIESEFRGAFSDIVFAITDWSPERKSLGPFRDVFLPTTTAPEQT